jgi:hypothetical protein
MDMRRQLRVTETAILASNQKYLIGGTNLGHRCYFTREMYEEELAWNAAGFGRPIFVTDTAEFPTLEFEHDELNGLQVTAAFDPQSETWYVTTPASSTSDHLID